MGSKFYELQGKHEGKSCNYIFNQKYWPKGALNVQAVVTEKSDASVLHYADMLPS
jgi:hypothetical protein